MALRTTTLAAGVRRNARTHQEWRLLVEQTVRAVGEHASVGRLDDACDGHAAFVGRAQQCRLGRHRRAREVRTHELDDERSARAVRREQLERPRLPRRSARQPPDAAHLAAEQAFEASREVVAAHVFQRGSRYYAPA